MIWVVLEGTTVSGLLQLKDHFTGQVSHAENEPDLETPGGYINDSLDRLVQRSLK